MMPRKYLFDGGRPRARPIRVNDAFRWVGLAILTAACLLLINPLAQAAPLNLTQSYPDFVVGTLDYNFVTDGDGGTLTIDGLVTSYTEVPGGAIENNTVRNEIAALDGCTTCGSEAFSLTVELDGAGNILSGSFYIDGVVTESGSPNALNLNGVDYNGFNHPSEHLLSGDLSNFGWAGISGTSGATLEFNFGNADGLIATGPLAEASSPWAGGGMILELFDSTLGTDNFETLFLDQNWSSITTINNIGDVFVPVPAAAWLFGSGLLALFGIRKRQSHR